jgi:hypothetical protein
MRIELMSSASLLAAGAAAVAIVAAPTAAAAVPASTQPMCTATATASECQSPGNVQISATPPPADYYPYYLHGGVPVLLGSHGFHGGGFHGGGHR